MLQISSVFVLHSLYVHMLPFFICVLVQFKRLTENPFEFYIYIYFRLGSSMKKAKERKGNRIRIPCCCIHVLRIFFSSNGYINNSNATKRTEATVVATSIHTHLYPNRIVDDVKARAFMMMVNVRTEIAYRIQFVTLVWRIDIVNVNKVNADILYEMQ